LNAIESVQLAPAASDVEQVFAANEKSLAFVPVKTKDFTVNAVVLVFLSVTTCAAEVVPVFVVANFRLAGVNETVASAAPVPFSATVCGEPVALSVVVRLAVALPAAAGLNAIESVQLAPTARDVEQVLAVSKKSLALVPVKT